MDYVQGDDMDGEDGDLLGAISRQMVSRGGGAARRVWRSPPLPARGAQSQVAELRSYIGFPTAQWIIGDATNKVLIVEPQESFRGERLIIDTTLGAATNAPLITLARIDVGSLPQSPSVEFSAPSAMFRTDATFSNLDLQVCFRGTKLQVTLGITAAPVGGAVTSVVGMFGQWIR